MRFNGNHLPEEGEIVYKIDLNIEPDRVIRSTFTLGNRFLFWPDMFTTLEDLDNCPVFSDYAEAEAFLREYQQ
ncbi:MAG: hypothetical protein SF052_14065 [Bacteroidia bacterium]|nr:hypothetical protein [Bacteroidia bacterium]